MKLGAREPRTTTTTLAKPGPVQHARQQLGAARLAVALAPPAAVLAALALLVAGIAIGAVLVLLYTGGRK